MSTNETTITIYNELVILLPTEESMDSPTVRLDKREGVHALCLKHGTAMMQCALDQLSESEDLSHRMTAAAFRPHLDAVTAVLGFEEAP